MRAGVLVIIGAILPLVLGATLGSITTVEGKGTWAFPMQPTAFLLLSLGLAVSHLLVLIGFLDNHAAAMGRTALSYATEHIDPLDRARYRAMR